MFFTEHRRSELIRNRNNPVMLHQTKREGARKNNIQRHKRHTSLFSKLPDVLVVEILCRLPPKSFFRCRCVCKTWLSLSSDAVRLNKHLQPTMRGFVYNEGCGVGFVNLSCDINEVEVDETIGALSCHKQFMLILDSCNGLLLVKAYNKKSPFTHNVTVYNPVTRTLFTLFSCKLHDQAFYSLAFDPQVFHQFHVIRFTAGFGVKVNFLDIFSYERGKCKRHKKLVFDVRIHLYSKGTFVDGRVHRLTNQDEILSIDLNSCSCQVIRPPNLENRDLIEIGQSQGVLHCLSVCSDKRLFIWVLESYTRQEWTLKYQLSLDAMYEVPMPDFYHFSDRIRWHFAFHPEKDVLFMPLGKKDFVSLDLSTGKEDKLDSMVRGQHCWTYTPYYLV